MTEGRERAAIVVVALNPAIDVTYGVERLRPGTTNRVGAIHTRIGGKPLNVARILTALGNDVTVVGFATADLIARIEAAADLFPVCSWVPVPGEARRTVILVEGNGQATAVNEPGVQIAEANWGRLVAAVDEHLPAAAVVLSGSLPPGVPDDAYAQLVGLVKAAGTFVALDTSGRALAPGVTAGPDLLKPNAAELAELIPPRADDEDTKKRSLVVRDVVAEAAAVRGLGAAAVVASLGRDGLVAVTDDGRWAVRPPVVIGNPTGAGDAVVASLVSTHGTPLDWPERLRRAAALGAAAVLDPTAGVFDPARYADLVARTTVATADVSP